MCYKKRDGVYKKYKNDKLIEVNTYEKGKHVGFRQVITMFTMNEYDLNGHLIYCGGYKVKENDVYVRDDIGKEYCNDRNVFEGEWKDGIPDGHGKMYLDNGTCIVLKSIYFISTNLYRFIIHVQCHIQLFTSISTI